MTAPHTPVDVVRHLGELTRELGDLTEALAISELDAARKRHAADLAESKAFLTAEGPMDVRRHTARVAAAAEEEAALVLEAVVRATRARIRAVQTRVDVGRSYGATMRAELQTLGGAP